MTITAKQKEALENIVKRSKGWPVGIYTDEVVAKQLVEKKLAEWGMSYQPTPKGFVAIKITSVGRAVLKYHDLE